jgi:hypothetical protein
LLWFFWHCHKNMMKTVWFLQKFAEIEVSFTMKTNFVNWNLNKIQSSTHSIFLHLFRFSVSLGNVLFSVYLFYMSFIDFIPKYFIFQGFCISNYGFYVDIASCDLAKLLISSRGNFVYYTWFS